MLSQLGAILQFSCYFGASETYAPALATLVATIFVIAKLSSSWQVHLNWS
jgi:hypothetical protein